MSAPPDPAVVLLKKAREDAHIARLVRNDVEVSDEHVGFFCQQAIEKSMKSVLSRRGVRYRRGHDMAEYLDLLKRSDIAYPPELDQSVALTPFGAELRYDYLPPEAEETTHFDREAAILLVDRAIE